MNLGAPDSSVLAAWASTAQNPSKGYSRPRGSGDREF